MNTPEGGVALAALRLDDAELVEAGDPGGMLRQVASSAAQVRTALRACAEADLSELRPDVRPRAIVVAGSGGAGGSVFACDALAAICGTGSPVQVTGTFGYQLPGWIGAADLVIAVSRSGHTAEAIALAGEAARRGCHLVGVGAPGSPLQELAARARGTFIPVTTVGPARAMAWALTVPLLVAAARLGVARISDEDYEAAAAIMEDVSHQCRPSSESFVNPAKSLALDLVGRLPVIWGGSALAAAAAGRFASQLAANAKYPAVLGLLPAAGHDQVAAFDGPYAPSPEPAFPAAEDFGGSGGFARAGSATRNSARSPTRATTSSAWTARPWTRRSCGSCCSRIRRASTRPWNGPGPPRRRSRRPGASTCPRSRWRAAGRCGGWPAWCS